MALCLMASTAFAQGIKVKSPVGKVEDHGEAKPAERKESDEIDPPDRNPNGGAVTEFLRRLQAVQDASNNGKINKAELDRMVEDARSKFQEEMQRIEEREAEMREIEDPTERAEEAREVRRERYLIGLEALRDDLVFRVIRVRKANDHWENELDDLEDKIKDHFELIFDQFNEAAPIQWQTVFVIAKGAHGLYHKKVAAYEALGGMPVGEDSIAEKITQLKKRLRSRLQRIRRISEEQAENELDDVEEDLLAFYEDLEDTIDDAGPENWPGLLSNAQVKYDHFTKVLDKYAKVASSEKAGQTPDAKVRKLRGALLSRLNRIRISVDVEHQDELDDLEDRIDDTFDDLEDDAESMSSVKAVKLLERAARFYAEFERSLDVYNVDKAVSKTIVGGVRVSVLSKLMKRQLGLTHGVSVDQLTDRTGQLATIVAVHDIILKVDGKLVQDVKSLNSLIKSGVSVEFLRAGKRQTLVVK
jgi:hypothetical protein